MNKRTLSAALAGVMLASGAAAQIVTPGMGRTGAAAGGLGAAASAAPAYDGWRSDFRRMLTADRFDMGLMASLLPFYANPEVDRTALFAGLEPALASRFEGTVARLCDPNIPNGVKTEEFTFLIMLKQQMPESVAPVNKEKFEAARQAVDAWYLGWAERKFSDEIKSFDDGKEKASSPVPAAFETYDAGRLAENEAASLAADMAESYRSGMINGDARRLARLVRRNPGNETVSQKAVMAVLGSRTAEVFKASAYKTISKAGLTEKAQLTLIERVFDSGDVRLPKIVRAMAVRSQSPAVMNAAYESMMAAARWHGDAGRSKETRAFEKQAAKVLAAMRAPDELPLGMTLLKWSTAAAAALTAAAAWVIMAAAAAGAAPLWAFGCALSAFAAAIAGLYLLGKV
jgi:hypothetical protein